jgi:hypothetical protein
VLLVACGGEEEPVTPTPEESSTPKAEQAVAPEQEAPTPPAPPIHEDFQGEPKLSLFPRAGDFRPEDDDNERLPFWRTFIDHLNRISGLVKAQEDDNRAWSFRSIDTIDSLGWFSPLAVEPNTDYTVSFRIKAELPEDAAAGVGILEYNEFLWVGEQYTESLHKDHFRGSRAGTRLTGSIDWEEHSFNLTTGPDTHMIHLVLYREGWHSREGVLFDDIEVKVAGGP